jgi:hypothetical protein
VPGTDIVTVGYPAVNAYLAAQGAAVVVAGYLDPAQLAAALPPSAAECAEMAGLPAAQVGGHVVIRNLPELLLSSSVRECSSRDGN